MKDYKGKYKKLKSFTYIKKCEPTENFVFCCFVKMSTKLEITSKSLRSNASMLVTIVEITPDFIALVLFFSGHTMPHAGS